MGQTFENSKGAYEVLRCYTSGNVSTCDIITSLEKQKIKVANQLNIFPNPATSFITINVNGGQPIEEAIIYNHLGQKALETLPVNNTVDVSTLKPGIYFLEVITSESRAGTKLIID